MINEILIVLFAISVIGFIVSLFFIKKTLVPMFIAVVAVNILNVFIQF